MKRRISSTLWGLFFIAIGVGFAGNVLGIWDFRLFFRGWWTLLIIIPCFISMIQGDFGIGSTTGFIFGVLLLIAYRIDLSFSVWQMVVPFILIYIGFRFLFQNAFRRPKKKKIHIESEDGKKTDDVGEIPEYNSVFASNKVIVDTNFNGATCTSVFGSITLDLKNAIIDQDVEVSASAIFGGIDIYLPDDVKVKTSNVPIFGGVSNKYQSSQDPEAYTVYINATCMFGGIDIK